MGIYMMFFMPTPPEVNQPAATKTAQGGSNPIASSIEPAVVATKSSSHSEKAVKHVASNVSAQAVTIETDEYLATFSNQGAVLTGFELKKFLNRHSQKPIQLINQDASRPRPFSVTYAPIPDLAQRVFEVEGSSKKLSKSEPVAKLVFRAVDNNGLVLEKTFTFKNGTYLFDFNVNVSQTGKTTVPASVITVEWADTLGKEEITGTNTRGAQSYRVVTLGGGHKDEESSQKSQESKEIPSPINWTALANQYFLAALIPDPTSNGVTVKVVRDFNVYKTPTEEEPNPGLDEKQFGPRPLLIFAVPSLNKGESFKRNGQAFVGPQDYEVLKGLDQGLEGVIDFGMFGYIAVYMLKLHKWFYTLVHNWGLAILFLSIAVKLALWYPTHNSYKHMAQLSQKTREIQPKLDAIKRKYADNKQKQQEETMKIYNEAGINPLGGCLPMLLQIPVFYALYATLSHSIELRGAHFLWLTDLTLKDDRLYVPVLSLLMGATMLIQQKVSGQMATQAAGQQKFMMWFLPIFLTFISKDWPAGLLLYWVVTNLLSMVQQKIVNREIQKTKKKDEVVKT